MRSLFTIPLLLIFVSGCRNNDPEFDYSEFTHVVKRGKFELYVPNYLKTDKTLNKKADLQYADTLNTTFMILIREGIPQLEKDSINITAEEYFTFAKAGIMEELENARDNDDTVTVINGLEAMSSELTGEYAGQGVYYRITVIADEDYFYQILYWTVRQQKDLYKDDFYASVVSFKPL